MYIKAIVLNTNDTISNCLQPLFCDKYKNLEISHVRVGRGPKTTFSIADTADSSVADSGDLIEYSGSGIVNRSITPILSRHFTGLPVFMAHWPIFFNSLIYSNAMLG